MRRLVHRSSKRDVVSSVRRRADDGDRRYADALIYDRDAKLCRNFIADLYQIARLVGDLGVNFLRGFVDIGIDAVKQADAHRDRADVEILLLDHRDRFGYVFDVHLCALDVVHGVKYRRALDVDFNF